MGFRRSARRLHWLPSLDEWKSCPVSFRNRAPRAGPRGFPAIVAEGAGKSRAFRKLLGPAPDDLLDRPVQRRAKEGSAIHDERLLGDFRSALQRALVETVQSRNVAEKQLAEIRHGDGVAARNTLAHELLDDIAEEGVQTGLGPEIVGSIEKLGGQGLHRVGRVALGLASVMGAEGGALG